jgi:hypothetical protein
MVIKSYRPEVLKIMMAIPRRGMLTYGCISKLGYVYMLSPKVAELAGDLLNDYQDVTWVDAPYIRGMVRVL